MLIPLCGAGWWKASRLYQASRPVNGQVLLPYLTWSRCVGKVYRESDRWTDVLSWQMLPPPFLHTSRRHGPHASARVRPITRNTNQYARFQCRDVVSMPSGRGMHITVDECRRWDSFSLWVAGPDRLAGWLCVILAVVANWLLAGDIWRQSLSQKDERRAAIIDCCCCCCIQLAVTGLNLMLGDT